MSLGAITVAEFAGRGAHPFFADVVTIVGESSYAAGGSVLNAAFEAAIGAEREIMAVLPVDAFGYVLGYDKAAGKLKVYYSNSDAADGPLIEVPDTTNLSGVTFRVIVFSR